MEAVRDIRRTWPRYRCRIMAVTADAFEDTRDKCIAVRACARPSPAAAAGAAALPAHNGCWWGAVCRLRPPGTPPRLTLPCPAPPPRPRTQSGFDGWLAKPFRVEEFAKIMAGCRAGGALTPSRPA